MALNLTKIKQCLLHHTKQCLLHHTYRIFVHTRDTVDGTTYAPVGRWFIPVHSHDLQSLTPNKSQLVPAFATIHSSDSWGLCQQKPKTKHSFKHFCGTGSDGKFTDPFFLLVKTQCFPRRFAPWMTVHSQLWPWLLVIAGYFNGILHSISFYEVESYIIMLLNYTFPYSINYSI